ncbi:MAG: IS21-like element helper ATPase IstB [Candidatus Marsarchaeota archaeon]|nr:IS21-like element helper ATPase IstB [Candidatus Marsarchaeota archaeon]
MPVNNDLVHLLKRLKLGHLAPTMPERLTLARTQQLDYEVFLEILLTDEIARRQERRLELRLKQAGFEDICRLEDFDWAAPIQIDQHLMRELFTLQFLERKENCLLVGPVGVGKTFLAQALGCTACRVGYSVLFCRADNLLKSLGQARADHSLEKELRRFLAPDLLIIDDFGLRKLTTQQSTDLYELVIERHRRASFIFTSNRDVSEWLSLFDDPILGNSALDRLANASHQIVIEGPSYRERLAPRNRRLAS